MDVKIRELTEKLYSEGVEKGNAQANEIVQNAQRKSEELLSQANKEAARIVAEAEKKALEMKKNTESELKLYAGQVVQSVKTAIADSLSGRVASANVEAAASDPQFMRDVILQMISGWAPGEPMEIETAQGEALKEYFVKHAKHLLDGGQVKISEVNNQKVQFVLKPQSGGYKVEFGEEELARYFQSFLRPALVSALF